MSLAERNARPPTVMVLSERHKHCARLLAAGFPVNMVAMRMGLTPQRISQLKQSPAFEELIAQFSVEPGMLDSIRDPIEHLRQIELQTTLRAALLRADIIQEIESSDEVGARADVVNRIYEGGADRVGFGKHQINHSVSDFASQLERACAERDKVMKIINIDQTGTPPPSGQEGARASSGFAPSSRLRRRA